MKIILPFIILFFGASSFLLGQSEWEIMNVTQKNEKGIYHFSFKPVLVLEYIENGKTKVAEEKAAEKFKDDILPTFDPKFSKLEVLIKFRLNAGNSKQSLGASAKVDYELKVTGGLENKSYDFRGHKFKKKGDAYVLRSRDIPKLKFTGTGPTSLEIVIKKVEGEEIKPNTTKFGYDVKWILDGTSIPAMNNSQNIRAKAAFYDIYSVYFTFSSFRSKASKQYQSIFITLQNIKNDIDDCFSKYAEDLDDPQNAIACFQVFGNSELQRYSLLKDKQVKALNGLRTADNLFFQENHKGLSLEELKIKRDEYIDLFCEISGYDCLHEKSYEENIKDLPPVPEPPVVTVTPCEQVEKYRKYNKVATLNKLLADCKSNDCDREICAKIKDRINNLRCQAQFENAKRESNIIAKRSALQTIVNDKNCTAFVKEAQLLLREIPELKIGDHEGPIKIRDLETGGFIYKYTVYFDSGVQLYLDSTSVQEWLEKKDLQKIEWREKDKIVDVYVNNIELDYKLIFRSLTTNDEEEFVLTKKKFSAKIVESLNRLIVELEHGQGPYFAQFTSLKKSNSFSIKLQYPVDTVDLDKLSRNYAGEYELMILDTNGKKGLESLKTIPIKAGFHPTLWMFLILPFLFLTGFIFYRNLPTEEE